MLGNVSGLALTPADARPDRVVLYFHGGGYVIGGPRSHGKFAAQIRARGTAAKCGWPITGLRRNIRIRRR
jgi:acetyl esterase/lipase